MCSQRSWEKFFQRNRFTKEATDWFSIVGQCLFHYVHKPIIRELVGTEEFESYSVESLADHIFRFSLAAIRSPMMMSDAVAAKEALS